jgi:hypothetical protein
MARLCFFRKSFPADQDALSAMTLKSFCPFELSWIVQLLKFLYIWCKQVSLAQTAPQLYILRIGLKCRKRNKRIKSAVSHFIPGRPGEKLVISAALVLFFWLAFFPRRWQEKTKQAD